MGQGDAEGKGCVKIALKKVVESPLLESLIKGAKAVLLNVRGGEDLGMLEVNETASLVCDEVNPSAMIIFGTSIKKEMKNKAPVTIVATGLGE
jgi:cell division protein FtsZ